MENIHKSQKKYLMESLRIEITWNDSYTTKTNYPTVQYPILLNQIYNFPEKYRGITRVRVIKKKRL